MTNEKTIYIERLDKGFIYTDVEQKTNAITNWGEVQAEIKLLLLQMLVSINKPSVNDAMIKISIDTNLSKSA